MVNAMELDRVRNALKDAGNDHDFVAFDTRYEKVHSGAADRIHRLMAKEGLRRLLAAGASNKKDAADLVARIRRISISGSRIEVETMKVWPELPK